jgi:hypothetical protein
MRYLLVVCGLLGTTGACGDSDDADTGDAAVKADTGTAAATGCKQRKVEGDGAMHFHHVHFNAADPAVDMALYEKLFGSEIVDFCTDQQSGDATRASKTERGYFLFTKVDENPSKDLNTFLEHVGWISPDATAEIARLKALDAPFWPGIDHYHCAEGMAGEAPCEIGGTGYFYLLAPNNARIEVSEGPGPAPAGFGHLHMVGGTDFEFFMDLTNGAFADTHIDDVNHIDFGINEFLLDGDLVDTRGRPIDHFAYSTTEFDAERTRIEAEGFEIVEDTSFKEDFGFRSFFVRTDRGVWVEIVEDSDFAP